MGWLMRNENTFYWDANGFNLCLGESGIGLMEIIYNGWWEILIPLLFSFFFTYISSYLLFRIPSHNQQPHLQHHSNTTLKMFESNLHHLNHLSMKSSMTPSQLFFELKGLLEMNRVSLFFHLVAIGIITDIDIDMIPWYALSLTFRFPKGTLPFFSFVPTRTVSWQGEVIAYKIRVSPLFSTGSRTRLISSMSSQWLLINRILLCLNLSLRYQNEYSPCCKMKMVLWRFEWTLRNWKSWWGCVRWMMWVVFFWFTIVHL